MGSDVDVGRPVTRGAAADDEGTGSAAAAQREATLDDEGAFCADGKAGAYLDDVVDIFGRWWMVVVNDTTNNEKEDV